MQTTTKSAQQSDTSEPHLPSGSINLPIPADAQRLPLSGRHHGLVRPQGSGLADIEHAEVCVEALNEAIHTFGPPEIMNTDQGSQLRSFAQTDRLKQVGPRISMDGKGRSIDNIFIERLWRSRKYECVYLHAWEIGSQARVGIGHRITFYNHHRPTPRIAVNRPPWSTSTQ